MWRERASSGILEEKSSVSVYIAIFHIEEDKNCFMGAIGESGRF